ncbi:MAG: hypothetical protein MI892_00200, partial [Desulfobacterales bacterium]|nr:hypothetical protein [Desulfobacterales bacterium]
MKRKLSLVLGLSLLLAAGGWITWEKSRPNNFTQWENHFKAKQEKKRKGIPGTKQARIKEVKKYFESLYTSLDGEKTLPQPNYRMLELEKAKARLATNNMKSGKAANKLNWVSRGPGNVSGRFRGLIVDPDDASNLTWYAGSATGGVWKTTDGGDNWTNLTPDLPYLATTTLAMSKANTNVIYIGTGESFAGEVSGGGVFKSTDKGENWTALTATSSLEDFRYVNRLEIDPKDENNVLAATGKGIFRTTDGGTSWEKVYSSVYTVDDLVADPTDFSRIYASEYGSGVLRS